jgi:hypothetical protein
MVPYSDSSGYFSAALNQALTGHWTTFASRRPFAAATRQLFALLGDYSYVRTVLIQAAAIAAMLWFCVYRLMRYQGAVAGSIFLLLVLILIEPWLGTFLTEPLATLWVLASCIFFIESLARNSKAFACLALSTLTFAMFARMGALLLVPALAAWIVWSFGSSARERALLAIYAGVAIAIPIGFNAGLAALYGDPNGATGANFGYTACSLTLGAGKSWHDCADLYKDVLIKQSEPDQAIFLLRKAAEQAIVHPSDLFNAIAHNAHQLTRPSVSFYLNGYMNHDWFSTAWQTVIGVIWVGLIGFYLLRCTNRARAFWIFGLTGIVASAVLVLQDDGRRTLLVSHVYVILLIACACSRQATFSGCWPLPIRWCVGATVAALLILGAVPAVSYLTFQKGLPPLQTLVAPPGSETILAGRRLTGFLVVPDKTPQTPIWPPAMTFSTFKHLITSVFGAELGPFLQGITGEAPFAFVSGLVIDGSEEMSMGLYTAPPDIFNCECRAVRAKVSPVPGDIQVQSITSFEPISIKVRDDVPKLKPALQ